MDRLDFYKQELNIQITSDDVPDMIYDISQFLIYEIARARSCRYDMSKYIFNLEDLYCYIMAYQNERSLFNSSAGHLRQDYLNLLNAQIHMIESKWRISQDPKKNL